MEAVGRLADELHDVVDRGDAIRGQELFRLANGISQVIDGEFVAATPPNDEPWLRIRAVDSSLFVVITKDEALLDRVRVTFREVRDSPEDDV